LIAEVPLLLFPYPKTVINIRKQPPSASDDQPDLPSPETALEPRTDRFSPYSQPRHPHAPDSGTTADI
jgi:hypothetical protein